MGYGVYLFFASLMVISIPYVYVSFRASFIITNFPLTALDQFFLPETKTVPLERMDELFGSDVRPWNAHAVVMSRMRDDRAMRADNMSVPRMSTPDLKSEDEKLEHV